MERIEGVGRFKYLGRMPDRSDNDCTSVLHNIRKERQVWGAAWEATSYGGGGSESLNKVLPHGSVGGTLVWSGDMGVHGDNESEDRGSACEFLETGHT